MNNGFRFEDNVYEFEDNGGLIGAFELPDGRFVVAGAIVETSPMGYCDLVQIILPSGNVVKAWQRGLTPEPIQSKMNAMSNPIQDKMNELNEINVPSEYSGIEISQEAYLTDLSELDEDSTIEYVSEVFNNTQRDIGWIEHRLSDLRTEVETLEGHKDDFEKIAQTLDELKEAIEQEAVVLIEIQEHVGSEEEAAALAVKMYREALATRDKDRNTLEVV